MIKINKIMEEEYTMEPEKAKSNGKKLKIISEFCFKWGFGGVKLKFKNNLINYLVEQGYSVIYKIIAMFPSNGEYFVYVEDKNNNKKIIFSNDEDKHKDSAIIGSEINENNIKEVVKKIEELTN